MLGLLILLNLTSGPVESVQDWQHMAQLRPTRLSDDPANLGQPWMKGAAGRATFPSPLRTDTSTLRETGKSLPGATKLQTWWKMTALRGTGKILKLDQLYIK